MNSEEIARIAQVSRSTVSRVINNYKNVPLETRERVQKVIDEYGYTPNISARTLAGKCNNIIGLFIADINETNSPSKWIGANSPYNSEYLANVITSCKRRGYLTLVNTITKVEECSDMEQYFENRMLYGGIFIGFPYRTKQLEDLSAKGYNVVLVDQLADVDDKNHKTKLINCNNFEGGYEASKYLIEQGRRNILHISGDNRLSSIERKNGFLKCVKDFGLKKQEYNIINGEYREDIAYKKMLEYLCNNNPDGVFVANDIMALGVIRAIKEKGLSVPNDISVIGFDNLEAAEWLQVNLSSMGIDMEEFAEKTVALLFSRDSGKHESCQVKLFRRNSVVKKITNNN